MAKNPFLSYELDGTVPFSDTVDVADPCYKPTCWCRKNAVGIVPGDWACLAGPSDPQWGWPAGMLLHNAAEGMPEPSQLRHIGEVGCDSARIGVFDSPFTRPDDVEDRDPLPGSYCVCNGADGGYPVYGRISAAHGGAFGSALDAIFVPFSELPAGLEP